MKIVAVEPIGISVERAEVIRENLLAKGCDFVIYYDRNENPEILVERMKDAEIVIVSNIPLREEVLSQCKKLKFLNVAFTGLDHIDLEYCKAHNIAVSNAAGYATDAVAELAIGLMLNILRRISSLDRATRNGESRNNFLGGELRGKRVGIVGTGAIGIATAKLLSAFGCEVIAWSRSEREVCKQAGIQYVSLEELMRTSDIISLHVPLTENTKNLINRELLELCKPTAIIINTARGGVIDNEALVELLNNEQIAGAGIDVFYQEPPLDKDYALLHAKNCVFTPHVGYATREAFDHRIDIILENIDKFCKK